MLADPTGRFHRLDRPLAIHGQGARVMGFPPLQLPRPPCAPLFPYTTLFRSVRVQPRGEIVAVSNVETPLRVLQNIDPIHSLRNKLGYTSNIRTSNPPVNPDSSGLHH